MIRKIISAIKRPFTKPYIPGKGEFENVAKKYNISETRIKYHYIYCCMRYGCMPFHYIIFDFYGRRHSSRKEFVCEAENFAFFARNYNSLLRSEETEVNNVFTDKARFNMKFSDFVGRDWIAISQAGGGTDIVGFKVFLHDHKCAIAKPLRGNGGHGVEILELKDEAVLESDFHRLIANGDYIIEEILEQCGELAKLNDTSINTIRVVTLREKDSGQCHVVGAALRVGKQGSVVDNFSSGGVMYPIDSSDGFVCGPGLDRIGNQYYFHPDSNVLMLGFRIPHYSEVIDCAFRAMQVVPSERLVGWDICVGRDRIYLVEGNLGSGAGTYQIGQVGRRAMLLKYF